MLFFMISLGASENIDYGQIKTAQQNPLIRTAADNSAQHVLTLQDPVIQKIITRQKQEELQDLQRLQTLLTPEAIKSARKMVEEYAKRQGIIKS